MGHEVWPVLGERGLFVRPVGFKALALPYEGKVAPLGELRPCLGRDQGGGLMVECPWWGCDLGLVMVLVPIVGCRSRVCFREGLMLPGWGSFLFAFCLFALVAWFGGRGPRRWC